ncbi:Peptidase, M23/M37 family [Pseudoalteromonas luteoviolacea B = ATCC 29581]|nr:Peptidase, M23/M37 family [Pseudoalteromonas luteoviolacea B = ATCC 29581]
MISTITRFFGRIFQPKQILIRHSGRVLTLNLSRFVQWVGFACLLGGLGWSFVATQGYVTQSVKVELLALKNRQFSSLWIDEKSQLEQQIAEQYAELEKLKQKQVLLQEVVDSLPASLMSSALSTDLTDQTPLSETLSGEDLAPDDADSLPDIHQSQGDTPETLSLSTNESDSDQNFAANAAILDNQMQTLRDLLTNSIAARHQIIAANLTEAGVLNGPLPTSAQGGPLHQVSDGALPADYLKLADEIVRLNELEQVIAALPSALPAEEFYVSSNYGLRKDPITGQRAFHKGVDLAGWHKTKIFAPADGKITKAGRNGGYGNFIEIQHANGVKTRFGHLHTIKVKKGQQVTKQDVIALMGSTGRSTSTHLHYEVLHNNKHINPIKLTKALSSVQ